MDVQTLEKDAFEPPVINPWRQKPTWRRPSREQVRFAMDLCHSELPYAERVATVATFTELDGPAISELIDHLKEVRRERLKRLRRKRRARR